MVPNVDNCLPARVDRQAKEADGADAAVPAGTTQKLLDLARQKKGASAINEFLTVCVLSILGAGDTWEHSGCEPHTLLLVALYSGAVEDCCGRSQGH